MRLRLLSVFLAGAVVSCAHAPLPGSSGVAVPVVDFYSTKEAYGEFSNFAPYPVFLDGRWWPTSEHYYQAHKYEDPERIEWVRAAPTPMEAALRGRNPDIPKRADWEREKDAVMERAVREKFRRHSRPRELLLSTGSARLFEHTANDCDWGDCGDRSGRNKLGRLLEKIREELKEKSRVSPGSSNEGPVQAP